MASVDLLPAATHHTWFRPAVGRHVAPQLLVLLALLALTASVVRSTAILSDSVLLADGSIATADCFRARVGQVLEGTVTATGAGATTATLPAVDPTRAFVLHSLSTAASDGVDGLASVELTDATTLTVHRPAGAAGTVTVAYAVVEYDCGVRVQRGTVPGDAAAVDVAIAPVRPDSSFATVSVRPSTYAGPADGAHRVTTTIAEPDRLRLAAGAAPAGADAVWAWQVVEFVRDADAAVQHLTTTVPDGNTTSTVTLPSTVDPTRTLVLAGVRGATDRQDSGTVTAALTGTDEVRLERGDGTGDLPVSLQVIELRDGTVVQHVGVTTTGTTSTATLPSPVDVTRSSVVSSATAWGGAAASARVDSPGTDLGRAVGRFRLTAPSTLRVERGSATGRASWEAQVVTWGGPAWWDAAYGDRRRIDVTTTTATPADYTLSVTVDHAAMVASGRALASGDDVRIVRHDGTGWVELDRILADGSGWGRSDTTLLFRSVDPIPADTVDTTYWLHHGEPTATAPPADPAAVFLVADDFESGLAAYAQRVTGAGWYDAADWSRRRAITVPAGTVPADVADVTIPVLLTDATMAGQVQPDGSDLRFTAADGTTPLAHELAAWDPSTGTLVAWVRVPAVAAASATQLWLYWGAADAPAQHDPTGAWSGAAGVWHLEEPLTSTSTHADASRQGRHGVLAGGTGSTARVDSVAGRGLRLAADAERLRLGQLAADDGAITLSGWARPTSPVGGTVLRADSAAGEHVGLALVPDGSGALTVQATLRDGLGVLRSATGGTVAVGATVHVGASWDGTTLRAWVDGAAVAAAPVASREVAVASLGAGASANAGLVPFDGVLDELRLDLAARGAAWFAATAALQADGPATTTAGAVQSGSWFGAGAWSARTPITVDAGVVDASGAGEDLVDFPLLVSLTDPTLAASAAGDGRDLVFTADDGVTRLDHELERWDPVTGELLAWVRIPLLSASVDTGLFLYHGNGAAVDQQDPAGVFSSGFVAVHHLDDDPEAAAP